MAKMMAHQYCINLQLGGEVGTRWEIVYTPLRDDLQESAAPPYVPLRAPGRLLRVVDARRSPRWLVLCYLRRDLERPTLPKTSRTISSTARKSPHTLYHSCRGVQHANLAFLVFRRIMTTQQTVYRRHRAMPDGAIFITTSRAKCVSKYHLADSHPTRHAPFAACAVNTAVSPIAPHPPLPILWSQWIVIPVLNGGEFLDFFV
ncbi:hypothetical protein B0H12DRAFT_1237070 [Mycena haematopus]|nr:hypothetical protein B0H12DRAFT_1237070 [Mycena haematopus]